MTNTTNYNLLLAEGTDLVNYLTQTNPNFSNLDSIIKGVSDLTTTPATEVTTGTAHAISKSLPDATVIKFTATSNWQTGDTMTLDGNPVTPLKTDGTTLKTGDYIIGSAVLMIQDGTRLTVLVASSPDAGDINYDNTVSGLTANKVQGAIDENAAAITTINSNLAAQVITPSTGPFVIIDRAFVVKYGKTVTVNIMWHPSSTITGSSILFGDLPIPNSSGSFYFDCSYDAGNAQCVMANDGKIYDDYSTLETGKIYKINLSYVSA